MDIMKSGGQCMYICICIYNMHALFSYKISGWASDIYNTFRLCKKETMLIWYYMYA